MPVTGNLPIGYVRTWNPLENVILAQFPHKGKPDPTAIGTWNFAMHKPEI
jgi:hypothetical protein